MWPVRRSAFQLSPGGRRQRFSSFPAVGLNLLWRLWPEAEDKALRGRNLSAVFRTLYRQVGGRCKTLPSCAHTWRVEKQCDKSTTRQPNASVHRKPYSSAKLVGRSALGFGVFGVNFLSWSR